MATITYTASVKTPVRVGEGVSIQARGTRDGALATVGNTMMWALEGRIFTSPHTTAANTAVTGPELAFVATTPMYLLDVPSGTTAIIQSLGLTQTGTVAGGAISVVLEVDTIKRYSTGGTNETSQSTRTDLPISPLCTLYSNPTALAGFGKRVYSSLLATNVSTDTSQSHVLWVPDVPHVLVGPAAFLVHVWAATTAPTLWHVMSWAELPTAQTLS